MSTQKKRTLNTHTSTENTFIALVQLCNISTVENTCKYVLKRDGLGKYHKNVSK